jgi:hypothetical protein
MIDLSTAPRRGRGDLGPGGPLARPHRDPGMIGSPPARVRTSWLCGTPEVSGLGVMLAGGPTQFGVVGLIVDASEWLRSGSVAVGRSPLGLRRGPGGTCRGGTHPRDRGAVVLNH